MKPQMRPAGESDKALPRRLNFTEAMLPVLACPADKPRVRLYDEKVRGLVYAIRRSGARDWYWYGRAKGIPKPIDYHIGDASDVPLMDARRIAKSIAAKAAEGVDPRGERRAAKDEARKAVTVGALWEAYRDQHLKVKGSANTLRTDASRYKLHLSAWKSKVVQTITRQDVADFHAELTRGKGKGANIADKTIKLLRRVLTWGKINPNPAAGGAVTFHGDTQRDRFLSVQEVQNLMTALDKCDNQTIADAIRFALLTGARRGNVCGCRWQDVHLEQGLWIIPRDQSKNRKPMTISLAPAAIDLLKRRRETLAEWLKKRKKRNRLAELEACPYVFPGRTPDEPLREIKTTWLEVCKAAKIKGVRFHDLRHTLASHMAMQGASLLLIGKQLGHANKQSTMRYSHLEIEAVRPATQAAIAAMFKREAEG